MKSDFDEAFAEQLSTRTVMPAEACSELGLSSERRRRATWLARWLKAARRWLINDGPQANG